MNLIETIDKCIELVKEEIEGYEYYISEFENKSAYSAVIKEWKEGVEIWKEHLNNLEFMKHETGLQEIDEMTEPTDEQIDELWDEIGGYYNLYPEVRNTIREALNRWGNVDIEE